ncbi:hypothetical protein OOZ15_11140 [Galbibacter sp. EGI 63066]|uniref:hypothetical protein n=1 Tax=Galbibacter sp. EGI 63066 TaxID=2993559 RepID=UPI002249999E|nr:hypothetical protein [Galbibacter sp. EGI 63066]MCX2680497.1 hypothetical protein [Galbibacter sp. EGI 63066]
MTIPKFLYHYYELDNGPFRNITECGYEKAVAVQNQISEGLNSKRPNNYIDLRFSLENRIREQFILKGGKPNRIDPFYFTLGECEWAKLWYVNPSVIKIPLSDFEAEHISFTYPDSMVSFQFYDEPKLATYRKDYNGQVFLLSEINNLIREYGLPSEEKCLTEERLKYDRYIEAQVWDDRIIKEYKNKV